MQTVILDGILFSAYLIPLKHAPLLVMQGGNGMLGCGYLSIETADKLGDALAVATGVASYQEMLDAEVKKVSRAAAALGVTPGMTGREALLKMK